MAAGEQKKLVLPYLQRADEISKMEPKVAYYCRMYAVEQGIAIPNRAQEITDVVRALMAKLEADKKRITLGDKAEDSAYCESFACTIFERADRADRAGKGDKNTAMTFYAASVFIDILRQFGELPADMAERQRYAAWKAADIRKAIREGRTPTAGPPLAEDSSLLPLPSADLPSILPDIAPDTHRTGSAASGPLPPPSNFTPPTNMDLSRDSYNSQGHPRDTYNAPPNSSMGQPRDSHNSAGSQPRDIDHRTDSAFNGAPLGHDRQMAGSTASSSFHPGDKVLYCTGGEEAPVRGTVAKVESSSGGEESYLVALSQNIVSARAADLAHEYEPGTRVWWFPVPSDHPREATVTELHMNQWRPAYVITLEDGSVHQTIDHHLKKQLQEASSDPILPASPPPPIATSPPRSPTKAASPGVSAPAGTPFQPPPTAHGGPSPAPFSRDGPSFPSGASGNASSSSAYPSLGGQQPSPPPAQPGGAYGRGAPPHQPPPQLPSGPSQAPSLAPLPTTMAPASAISLGAITEAHKHAKHAASSLSFEDVTSARKFLSEALRLISDPNAYKPK
ncbi:hypothetical protein WJX73_008904 [Symbiochloris irregularis]|uniref:Vacuolar protein sorting-associated protein VTA1-like protein n=1 Tax=Symbiochloris irregularis TaxID=706552 RepID=A0AAW1NYB7_9CHLO